MQAARRPVISPFQVLQLQRKIINFFIKHLEASNLLRRIIEERQKEVKTPDATLTGFLRSYK